MTLRTGVWVLGAIAAVTPALPASGPSTAARAAAAIQHDIRPGPGVTAVKTLSAYLPKLAGTAGDTDVYLLDSGKPGGTAFVAGGTHGSEIAGIMAATVIVEHARVQQGRLIVIPHANNSASTWPDPRRPGPEWLTIRTPSGDRKFRYGARYTRLDHQGEPDPEAFRHSADSAPLDGIEARNLDRAHPGRSDGTLTQQIAFAIVRLLETERVDLAFDLHESGPDSPLAWIMVAHPKNLDLAAMAVLSLDAEGIVMKLERSSETFRGLSHREWGDSTRAKAFLFETANPAMVADSSHADPVNDPRLPLARRVAVHLAAISAVVEARRSEAGSSEAIRIVNLPTVAELTRDGVGAYLK